MGQIRISINGVMQASHHAVLTEHAVQEVKRTLNDLQSCMDAGIQERLDIGTRLRKLCHTMEDIRKDTEYIRETAEYGANLYNSTEQKIVECFPR